MAFVGFWMIPLAFLFSLFLPVISFFETLTGAGQEKVFLPYDAENGVVWEYNEDDYSIIDCLKSETKDGQQIFTFRGKEASDEERPSGNKQKFVDDLYFEDENGNIKKYYAFVDFGYTEEFNSIMYGGMDIYEESECVTFEYTVKANKEVENCYWRVRDYNSEMNQQRFLYEENIVNMHERTYEFVLKPIYATVDHTFRMTFRYELANDILEEIEVTFEISGKEVRVIEEKHFVEDENKNMVEVA